MPIRPITVRVKEWDEGVLKALLDRLGHLEAHRIPQLNLLRLEPPEGTDTEALIAALEADPIVVHAYEAVTEHGIFGSVRRAVGSTDPQLVSQWHLIRHDFLGAWRYTTGAGAKIGDADTGTSPFADPDYQPTAAAGHGKGPANDNPTSPVDENYWYVNEDGSTGFFSHGVITSAIMWAERRNNGLKGAAAAPDCEFYFGRITNAQGALDTYAAMAEWTWMADNGVRAINNSWGISVGQTPGQLVSDFGTAIDYCWTRNCIVTVCAMNFGYVLGGTGSRSSNGILAPSMNTATTKWSHALIVGGVGALGDTNSWLDWPGEPASNWGPLVDIVAAAQETWTLSLDTNNGFPLVHGPHWGTSFADPLVTAAIGLMCSAYSGLTAQQCWDILKATAEPYRIEVTPEFYTGLTQANYLGPNAEFTNFYAGVPENNFDLNGNALSGGTDLTWQGYGHPENRSLHPSTYTWPNAKVLNACKAVLKAKTYDPANAHSIYPYLQAWGPGSLYVEDRAAMYAFDAATGNVTTTLDGQVAIEVTGFSSDPITSVELWLGSTLIYSGPPKILRAIASSSGTAQQLSVVAHTSGGQTTETYSDIVVASLTLQAQHWIGTTDPGLVKQWHLLRHDFFGAWRYTNGSGAKLGIIDSGVAAQVGEGNIWSGPMDPDYTPLAAGHGKGISGYPNSALDTNAIDAVDNTYKSHGTETSSQMCLEVPNNGVNGSAAAPGCELYAGVYQDATHADIYAAAAQWMWMADNGVAAINNSWGFFAPSDQPNNTQYSQSWGANIDPTWVAYITDLTAAIEYCWSKNCLVVVGVTNTAELLGSQYSSLWGGWCEIPEMSGTHTRQPHALIVSGSGLLGDCHGWDNGQGGYGGWGPFIDIVAALQECWVSTLDPVTGTPFKMGYQWGCSFASPLVTAAIGLMRAVNPNLTAQQMTDIIKASCDDFRIETTPDFYTNCPTSDFMGPNNTSATFGTPPEVRYYLDGTPTPNLNSGGPLNTPWQGYAPDFRALYPSLYAFPNAGGVLNACKAVLTALTLVPANVSKVYPYLQAWGPGTLAYETRKPMYAFNPTTGGIITTLNGDVALEVRGFSTDPITSVELWLGNTKVYDGPPGILRCKASVAGQAQPLKIVTHTAGNSASETYSDFVVASLRVNPATYVIDQAHGSDDQSVCDWNTCVNWVYPVFGYNPADTGLWLCAPNTMVTGEPLDTTTTRTGVLFRNVTFGAGESFLRATLRLYLLDWEPDGYVDPTPVFGSYLPAENPYIVHVHGCKKFAPAPGYDECPGPSAPGWGNLPAAPLNVYGTGVIFDAMTVGAGGPTQWGAEKPGWPGGTRNWYPARFDSASGPESMGTGSSTTIEIGLRTDARTIALIGRTKGYVDIDVTAQVQEILSCNYSQFAPPWTARTYKYAERPAGSIVPVWLIPQVTAPNGYIYTFVGNGVPWDNGGYAHLERGFSGVSNTPPSQTVIGGEEQPDGPGTAIWRCAKQGTIRNWQSGDNLAFVLVLRDSRASYGFQQIPFPGWRVFASGDLGDPNKYPQLLIYTEAPNEGSQTLAFSPAIASNAVYTVGSSPYTQNIHPTFTANAVFAGVQTLSVNSSMAFAPDASYAPPLFVSLPAFTMGLASDGIALGTASIIRRNLRMGAGYVYAYVGPSYDAPISFGASVALTPVRSLRAFNALAFGTHPTLVLARSLIIKPSLSFATTLSTDTGFGDHWLTNLAFPASPVYTPKGIFKGTRKLTLPAHPALAFGPGVLINRSLRFGPAHMGMGQVSFGPEAVSLRAGVDLHIDSIVEAFLFREFHAAPTLHQKGLVKMLSALPPLSASPAVTMSYLRERSNVLLVTANTDMVQVPQYDEVGRLFFYSYPKMGLKGILQMHDEHLFFAAHPKYRVEIAKEKKPPGPPLPHQTTLYTPGGVLISEQPIVATSEEEARAKALKEGMGAITSKEKPVYFSDPMEELELAEHEAGTVLKP